MLEKATTKGQKPKTMEKKRPTSAELLRMRQAREARARARAQGLSATRLRKSASQEMKQTGEECAAQLDRARAPMHRLPHGKDGPKFAPADPSKPAEPIQFDKVGFMTHGLPAKHLGFALRQGQLCSGYSRAGPNGSFTRKNDKLYGGVTGVYTRAYSNTHSFEIGSQGVGSGEGKVIVVMSPEIMKTSVWRASTFDGMGAIPGVTKAYGKVNLKDPAAIKKAWELQSEAERNEAFMKTMAPGEDLMGHAEQLHYEGIPLEGVAKAVICTDSAAVDTVMATLDAVRLKVPDGNIVGYITVGKEKIKVLQVTPTTMLNEALKTAGVADAAGRVR